MTTFWIGVAAASHVAKGVAGDFAMFAHGSHAAAKRVRTGDWVAYYSPREGIRDGAERRQFTAIGRAVDGAPRESVMAPGIAGWQRPMCWLAATPADVYPLLDKFTFVSDRRHWGVYFRRSLFKVERADFSLIAEAMGVSDQLN